MKCDLYCSCLKIHGFIQEKQTENSNTISIYQYGLSFPSVSEAHDSGLCAADKQTKNRFASDIQNLTLASPTVNRDEKSGYDASGWLPLPKKNKCWFANKVIAVKKAYNLTVDSEELMALEKALSKCSSFSLL